MSETTEFAPETLRLIGQCEVRRADARKRFAGAVVDSFERFVNFIADHMPHAGKDRGHRQRTLVALAGGPGSGKSTLSSTLVAALNARTGESVTAAVEMDGFHRSNDWLAKHRLESVKGSPVTFDDEAFGRLIVKVKNESSADVVVPVYDRSIHGVRENGSVVRARDSVVFVEGNYLFIDQASWRGVRSLYNIKAYVDVDVRAQCRRLMTRHLYYGRTPDQAELKIRNDIRNTLVCLESMANADLLVSLAG